MVTTPEASAMADAYGVIKVMVRKKYDRPMSLIVNMAHSPAEGKQVYQRMADVTRKFLQTNLYYAGMPCSRMSGCARGPSPQARGSRLSQGADQFLVRDAGGADRGSRRDGLGQFLPKGVAVVELTQVGGHYADNQIYGLVGPQARQAR